MNSYLFANIFLLMTLITQQSWCAACCGGAGAMPALITGDEKSVANSTLIQSDVQASVSSSGIWRKENRSNQTHTVRLDYAHIFADRFQVGISLPMTQRRVELENTKTSSGVGDLNLQSGYEYLTDWDYSFWRPRGVGYFAVNIPSGLSKYETLEQSEIRGKGFYSAAVGTVLTKSWIKWDVLAGLELRRGFAREFNSNVYSGEVIPQWGKSLTVGLGYHIGSFRSGAMLSWNDEDSKKNKVKGVPSEFSASEASERFSTGTLSFTYNASTDWSGSLSYSDQAIFGNPVNTTLAQTWALSLQRRWQR
jgi:hypothetical protein